MAIRLDPLTNEALRLASIASDMEERLAALRSQAEAASDLGHPGPTPYDLVHAEKLAKAARAQAEAARRMANGDRYRGRRRRAA